MPDNLDILIRTTADTSGAESADAALAQLRAQVAAAKDDSAQYNAWLQKNAATLGQVSQAEQAAIAATQAAVQKKFQTGTISDGSSAAAASSLAAAAATGEHTRRVEGLHKATGLLAHQFGALGTIVKFAFTNPISFAVAALAVGLRNVSQAASELSDKMNTVAASTGAAIGDIKGSLQAVLLQYAAANEALKLSQEDLDRKIKAATISIDAQKDALLELIAARKSSDLASATTDTDRAAVEARYRAAEAEVKQRADAATIAARQLELDRLRAQSAQQSAAAQKDLGGRSEFQVKVDLEDIPKQRDSVKANLEALKAELSEFENMGVAKSTAALAKFGNVQAIKDHVEGLRGAITQAKTALVDLDAQQLKLTRGQAEAKAAQELQKRIADLSAQLNGLQTRFAAAWQARAVETGGQPAKLAYDAAAGARAVQSGQAANPEQAAAIKRLSEMFGLRQLSQKDMLAMLAKILDTEAGFNKSIQEVARRSGQPVKPAAPAPAFTPPTTPKPAVPAPPPTVPPPPADRGRPAPATPPAKTTPPPVAAPLQPTAPPSPSGRGQASGSEQPTARRGEGESKPKPTPPVSPAIDPAADRVNFGIETRDDKKANAIASEIGRLKRESKPTSTPTAPPTQPAPTTTTSPTFAPSPLPADAASPPPAPWAGKPETGNLKPEPPPPPPVSGLSPLPLPAPPPVFNAPKDTTAAIAQQIASNLREIRANNAKAWDTMFKEVADLKSDAKRNADRIEVAANRR